jgi:hypothetical protein
VDRPVALDNLVRHTNANGHTIFYHETYAVSSKIDFVAPLFDVRSPERSDSPSHSGELPLLPVHYGCPSIRRRLNARGFTVELQAERGFVD